MFHFKGKGPEVFQCLCWRQSICRPSVDEYQIVNGTNTAGFCVLYIVSYLSSYRGNYLEYEDVVLPV